MEECAYLLAMVFHSEDNNSESIIKRDYCAQLVNQLTTYTKSHSKGHAFDQK